MGINFILTWSQMEFDGAQFIFSFAPASTEISKWALVYLESRPMIHKFG